MQSQEELRPQEFWNCVNEVCNLFECTSVSQSFDQVWKEKWRIFEQKCKNVVKNRYILERAVHFYQQEKNETKLREHIIQTCKELGLDHDEWLEHGWAHVIKKCKHT